MVSSVVCSSAVRLATSDSSPAVPPDGSFRLPTASYRARCRPAPRSTSRRRSRRRCARAVPEGARRLRRWICRGSRRRVLKPYDARVTGTYFARSASRSDPAFRPWTDRSRLSGLCDPIAKDPCCQATCLPGASYVTRSNQNCLSSQCVSRRVPSLNR